MCHWSVVFRNIPRTQFSQLGNIKAYFCKIKINKYKNQKQYTVGASLTMREGDLERLGGVSELPQRQAAVRVTAHELLPFVMPAD